MYTNIKSYISGKFIRGSFLTNVLTLMTGTTIAQALSIIIAPLLTRLYTPDDFGTYAIYLSLVSFIVVIACGKYELAIMLPDEENDAVNVLSLSIILTFFVSIVTLVIVLIFNSEIVRLLGNVKIEKWLYLVPVAVFFAGCYQALNYWFNRKESYVILASNRINQSISSATFNLIMGMKGFGAGGLIIGTFIGQSISLSFLVWHFLKELKIGNKWLISYEEIKKQANRYLDFPRYQLAASCLCEASAQVPILLLSAFFETSAVGFYSLAHRCVSLPMGVLGSAVGQAFFQKASEYKSDDEKLKELTYKTYKKLLFVGILPFTILMIFGDVIFSFIFGAEWYIAGRYAQILSLWLLFVFISSPLSAIFIVKELQKQNLFFNSLLFISRAGSLVVGGLYFHDPMITIFLYGIVGFLLWLCFCMYLLNIVKISYKNSLGFTFSIISICSVIVFCIRLLIL